MVINVNISEKGLPTEPFICTWMGLVISMRPVLPELDRRLPSQGHQDRKSILVVHISWSTKELKDTCFCRNKCSMLLPLIFWITLESFCFCFGCAVQLLGSSFPDQGLNPGWQQWRVLTAGLPGHCLKLFYGNMCGNELDLKKNLLFIWLH